MAMNRMYLRCKGCGKEMVLAKMASPGEWFFARSDEEKGRELREFLDEHEECCRNVDESLIDWTWEDSRFFELVYENDPDWGRKKSLQQLTKELEQPMTYGKIQLLLKEEAWVSDGHWNNREMFHLENAPRYQVFEHQCEIGIVNPFAKTLELIYCNMTADELREYGRLCERLNVCEAEPETVTVAAYRAAKQKLREFMERMKRK